MTKQDLVSLLKLNTCKIVFTKADGTTRDMVCTLKEGSFTPPEKKTDKVRPANNDVVSVWDLENEGWRSFRVESVISAEVKT